MTHLITATNLKIPFPLIFIKFIGEQLSSIKELRDDLIVKWKNQHRIDLIIIARFGLIHSLLIFAEDSPIFQSLLDGNQWSMTLKEEEELEVNLSACS